MVLSIDTSAVLDRVGQNGDLKPEDFLDSDKVTEALQDGSSTFLQFVALYYSIFATLNPGFNALSMLPGGFSPKEQTAAYLLNRDKVGAVGSMTSIDADMPTLERLRGLFKKRFEKAAFLDHLVHGDVMDMPFLARTFDCAIMNHGIDDIVTYSALSDLGNPEFIYHPSYAKMAEHAAICARVAAKVIETLSGKVSAIKCVTEQAVKTLVEGGIFVVTNYPSHHFATYNAISGGEGYYRDITKATNICFEAMREWAITSTDVQLVECNVQPFSLGFIFEGKEQVFTTDNIAIIQKT